MSNGRAYSRFVDTKRTFAKPIAISTEVLLDRERCVLCARCTRFSEQIAGDAFIEMLERGPGQQVGVAADKPFQSYFSGNTIQICPVGALTSAGYRFRSRPHSAEELAFLAAHVVGVTPDNGAVTYDDLSAASAVLCVAFEPEEESPIVYLRLRRAARDGQLPVWHLGQFTTPAVRRTFGTLLRVLPGSEAAFLQALSAEEPAVREALSKPDAVLLVGERAGEVPGLHTAAARLAADTGARLAWIPRRAGERGALEAGAVPTLLPGGRPVTDDVARAEVEQAWGVTVQNRPGRDTAGIVAAAAAGQLGGLVIGGVDPFDLPDPRLAEQALSRARFVVSLEMRLSAVTRAANVVLPIAPAVEKSGSYLDWEGRRRQFGTTITSGSSISRAALSDCRVLDSLGVEMDVDLFTQTPAAAWAGLAALGTYGGIKRDTNRHAGGSPTAPAAPQPGSNASEGKVLLATWRRLLDNGSMQDGEPALAGTGRAAVALLSEATAADLGVHLGGKITVSAQRGAITLPVAAADLPPGVVWVPGNSGPATVRRTLGVGHGAVVTVRGGDGRASRTTTSTQTGWGGRARHPLAARPPTPRRGSPPPERRR